MAAKAVTVAEAAAAAAAMAAAATSMHYLVLHVNPIENSRTKRYSFRSPQ
jgi:hypothetical protein